MTLDLGLGTRIQGLRTFRFAVLLAGVFLGTFAGRARAACPVITSTPTACSTTVGYVTNVSKLCAGVQNFYSTIQAGVRALPGNISLGNACVVIRDTQTYSEQVNIPDISMSSYTVGNNQIEILLDPSLSSGPWVNAPNSATQASTAAFVITQASVTIGGGILVLSTNTVSYGIYASSAYVTISSVNVQDGSGANSVITQAGISISSWSTVSYSSVTVQAAHGFYLPGSFMTTVSYSSAAVLNSANFYPFYLNGASSNTFTVILSSGILGDSFEIANGAHDNIINNSTMTTNAGGNNALYLNSSSNTITGSYISNPSGSGAYFAAGSYNTIRQSTMTSNDATGLYSALAFAASNNTVTGSYISNLSGYGAYFGVGSYNTISQSTMTSSGSDTLYFLGASSNTVTGSYISNSVGNGVRFAAGSYNTIRQSTMTSNDATALYSALYFFASNNTVTGSYMSNPSGFAAVCRGSYNTISQSTMTSSGSVALYFSSSGSSNTVTGSYISNPLGNGAGFGAGSYNTIRQSTVTGNSGNAALYFTAANNSVTGSLVSNTAGDAAYFLTGANTNTISMSTMSGAGYGINLAQGSSNTVSNCYIQGSTAAYVAGSTGTALNSNVIVGTSAYGSGVWVTGGNNLNLFMSSNVITGGAQGAGVYIDTNNAGSIYLTTNTILAGSQYGIFVATQTSGTQIYVTSNTIVSTAASANNTYGIYLNGLTTGATIQNNSLVYRNAGGGGGAYGLWAQSVKGLNFDHNRINNPGMIGSGGYVGAYFTGASQTSFKFNDVNSTGTALPNNNYYLVQLAASTVTIRDNIFFSSIGFSGSGSSASLTADAISGFNSDWNTWFSSNSYNTAVWGAQAYALGADWVNSSISADHNSKFGNSASGNSNNPFWANPGAGVEDFHPLSAGTGAGTGRYRPASNNFQPDGATSVTIDAADPAEPLTSAVYLPPANSGIEPSPNGNFANQGSYGQTDQASESTNACTAWTRPSVCSTVKNVAKAPSAQLPAGCTADATSIQAGVRLLPGNISLGNACVVIRDTQTYSEQVNIPDLSMSSYTVGNNQIEILLDPSLSSGPVVIPPAKVSTAAFHIMQASVTIGGGIMILSTNSVQYGVWASSAYVTISSVNVDSGGNIWTAGISISSWSTVSYSSVTVQSAHGLGVTGSINTVSYSTMSAKSSTQYALYLNAASSNTITQSFILNVIGTGTYLSAGALYNTISLSSMASSGSSSAGVLIRDSYNTFTRSYAGSSGSAGLRIGASANFNTVSLSTMNTTATGAAALEIDGSTNQVTQSYMSSSDIGTGVGVQIGGQYNTIRQSTMVSNGSSDGGGLDIGGGVAFYNAVTQSYMSSPGGWNGAVINGGASFNTISLSTITNAAGAADALSVGQGCLNNSFSQIYVNTSGNGGVILSGGGDIISQSTITANGSAAVGLDIESASSTITNSYVQASTAVYVFNSTGAVINSSVLVGANTYGSGLWLTGAGNSNLSMSSNVITGGSNGAGIYLDKNNSGSIYLSTNTILPGSAYGIFIATQVSGTQVYVASNTIVSTAASANNVYGIYLNGLTSGATIQNNSIVYRTAGGGPKTYYGLYGQSVKGLNIDHNRLSNPGMVVSGTAVEVYFTGANQVSFKFNDVFSTGTSLTNAYLVQLAGSTVAIRDNIFFSSFGVTGSSASFTADATSGFNSDYNTWFSSNSISNTAVWGAKAYALGLGWVNSSILADNNSKFGDAAGTSGPKTNNPYWANPGAGVEDFHPLSNVSGGRCIAPTGDYASACATWTSAADGAQSVTIDAADPNEGVGQEPNHPNNGTLPNQGSTGQTLQASQSSACSWTRPAVCSTTAGYVVNVSKLAPPTGCSAAQTTIQAGVRALPGNISAGNACVVIRDTQTYSEQVNIPDISMSSYTVGNNQIEILIDPSLSSGPWVNAPNSATKVSTAGFVITQASVTIGGGILVLSTNTVSYGVYASSAYVTISSISVQDGSGTASKITQAGISISSWSTVSYSSISVNAAHGFYLPSSFMTTVSYSSAAINSSKYYALYLQGASSNTFSVFLASNSAGYGAFISTSNYNTISLSTITTNSAASALYLNQASSNAVMNSYISGAAANDVAVIDANSTYNTVSQSTMIGAALNSSALYFNGCSYNSVLRSLMFNPQGDQVLLFYNGATYNTVQQSTVTTLSGANFAVRIGAGNTTDAFNTITQSYISNTIGKAVGIQGGHDNVIDHTSLYTDGSNALYIALSAVSNTVRFSTMVSNDSAGSSGVNIPANDGDSNNVFIGDYIAAVNIGGGGALETGGNFTTVIQSTLTSAGATSGSPGLLLVSSSNTVSQCYIQGSTAVTLSGSTGTIINSTVLVGTNTFGSGVWMDNTGSVNLFMSSNVIAGGPAGAGVYIDKNNSGGIYLTTNTFLPGSQYGIFVATQTSGTQIYVTSNTIVSTAASANNTYGIYLNGLTTGATIQNNSLVYRNAGGGGGAYGLYAQSVKGLNFDHNRINNPGMIGSGGYVGAYFAGASQVSFKFNDVNSTGTALPNNNYYLVQLAGSTVTIRDNIFFSSIGFSGSGSSASFTADGTSGFNLDYNTWFSSNSQNTAVWGGKAYALGPGWVNSSILADNNSKFGNSASGNGNNPFWANPGAGVEDFHPMSKGAGAGTGRYIPASNNFAPDGVTSITIDAADPAEPLTSAVRIPPANLGQEPSPNGSVANQGSYGQTDQASESQQACSNWATPVGCYAGYVRNVAAAPSAQLPVGCTADATTIQGGVRLLPGNISIGNACVVIRDTQTYSEQVNIPDISMSSYTVGNNQIEILLDTSLSSGPVVTPPAKVSTAAFVITQASVTISGGILILSTNTAQYGVWASSAYVTISSVNVDSGGKIWGAGVVISSNSTLSFSSVTVQNAYGLRITGSLNTISASSVAAAGASQASLYINSSSNTVTKSYLTNTLGNTLWIDAAGTYNTVSQSTASNTSAGKASFEFDGASNTVTGSYLFYSGSAGNAMQITSSYNTIQQSTMDAVGSASTSRTLYITGGNNQISGDFFMGSNTTADIVELNGASAVHNTISQSTMTGTAGADATPLFYFTNNASSNTLSQSYLLEPDDGFAGAGVLQFGSSYNTVSQSSITKMLSLRAGSAVWFGDRVSLASYNLVTQSFLAAPNSGNGSGAVEFNGGNGGGRDSTYNTISFSTITQGNAQQGVLFTATGGSFVDSNTVTNCYVQGSPAIDIAQSTGTFLNSNVLVSVSAGSQGVLAEAGSGINLFMSSNTILGGANSAGVYLGTGSVMGSVYLATNTFLPGSQYGIQIATQAAGTQIYVTSNTIISTAAAGNATYGIYLNGLQTGATIQNNSIVYRNVGGGGGAYGLWAQSVKGLNFDHNRINNPGMIGNGGYVGAYFTGALQTSFKFNDVNSTGTALGNSNYYLVQLAGSTVTIRDNIFFSSIGFSGSGSSASFKADAISGFNSDYNDWYSSNSYVTFAWGGTSTGTLAGMQNLFGGDSNSISANPFWRDSRSGVEDFHPLSTAGRCTGPAGDYFSACSGFATDGAQSSTIDAADPAETTTGPGGFGKEPSPNGCVPNQGSTGQTQQASKSVATLSVSVSTGYYNFSASGPINLSVTASTVSVSSIVVTNNGNATESYQLSAATTTAGSIWRLGSGSPGSEQPVLNALFSSTQPVSSAFAVVNSTITNTAVTCDATHYTGNQSCSSVAAQSSSGLWFQLWSPTNTIYAVPGSSAQHIQVTVTATSLGGVCSN